MQPYEYKKRINNTINYIDSNLSRSMVVEELAETAHYSPFHFHRLFKSVTGQPPCEYIWRQRIERAARILTYNKELRIIEVAEACGFSSAANFSRSFKLRFGITPRVAQRGNYFLCKSREKPVPNYLSGVEDHELTSRAQRFSRTWAQCQTQKIDNTGLVLRLDKDQQVAYYRSIGPYDCETLDDDFEKMADWVNENNLDTKLFGVPRSLTSFTPHWHCQHDVCVVLPESIQPGPDMNLQMLKGGLVAVLRCEINQGNLYYECRLIWDWLTTCWLPESSFQLGKRAPYEIYLKCRDAWMRKKILLEFCLPVRSLAESVL